MCFSLDWGFDDNGKMPTDVCIKIKVVGIEVG